MARIERVRPQRNEIMERERNGGRDEGRRREGHGEDQGKWMDNVWIETRGDEMKERSSGCGELGEGWKWRVNGSNDRRKSITTGWRSRLEDKRSTGKLGKQNGCGTVHGNGQRRKDIAEE